MSIAASPAKSARPRLLMDLAPAWCQSTVVIVTAATVFLALVSQIGVPLWFTPVPLTLGTFGVAAIGGGLGARRAGLSVAAYLIVGVLGAPVFYDAQGGWEVAAGDTAGYLVGYLVMALIIGAAADNRSDRRVGSFVAAICLGNAALYILGASWLAYRHNLPLITGGSSAFALGVRPFLIGDAIKMVVAGFTFPAAWWLVGRRSDSAQN